MDIFTNHSAENNFQSRATALNNVTDSKKQGSSCEIDSRSESQEVWVFDGTCGSTPHTQ
jgi:hypothetical protein